MSGKHNYYLITAPSSTAGSALKQYKIDNTIENSNIIAKLLVDDGLTAMNVWNSGKMVPAIEFESSIFSNVKSEDDVTSNPGRKKRLDNSRKDITIEDDVFKFKKEVYAFDKYTTSQRNNIKMFLLYQRDVLLPVPETNKSSADIFVSSFDIFPDSIKNVFLIFLIIIISLILISFGYLCFKFIKQQIGL